MEVETFRYLFSALIQVFGAIIAIGGIFMVWKYGEVQRQLEQLTKRLGVLTYFIEKDISRAEEIKQYNASQIRADEFLTYSPNAIQHIVEEKITKFENNITINKEAQIQSEEQGYKDGFEKKEINKYSYSKRRIKLYLKKYNHYLKLKNSFPQSICILSYCAL